MTEPHRDVAEALRREGRAHTLDPAARERIAQRLSRANRARRHVVRRIAATVAAALIAGVVATALVDPDSDANPVLQRAAAALDPSDQVLHYRATVIQPGASPRERHVESWLYPRENRVRGLERDRSGRVVVEFVATPAGTRFWTRERGIVRLPGRRSPDPLPAPSALVAGSGLEQVRRTLENGRVRGPLVRDRRRMYEIRASRSNAIGRWHDLYLVDAASFKPIRWEQRLVEARPRVVSPRAGDVVTTTFELVERLDPREAHDELRGSSQVR